MTSSWRYLFGCHTMAVPSLCKDVAEKPRLGLHGKALCGCSVHVPAIQSLRIRSGHSITSPRVQRSTDAK